MRKSTAIRIQFLANHFVRSSTDAAVAIHIANADWHIVIGVHEWLCRFDIRSVIAIKILVDWTSHAHNSLSVMTAAVHMHGCACHIRHQTRPWTAGMLRRAAQRMRWTTVQIRIAQFRRRHDCTSIDVRFSIAAGRNRNRRAAIQRMRSSILLHCR